MEKIDKNKIITPNQCRAARMLLDWMQKDLSEVSGVSRVTIVSFEKGSKITSTRTIKDIKRAFEDAGIRFENNDEKCLVEYTYSKS